jgi:hypothetical protein
MRFLILFLVLLPFTVPAQTSSSGGGVSSSSSGASGSGGYTGASVDGTDSSVGGVISSFATWLEEVLLYVPQWCWQQLLAALGAVIAAIPVPEGFTTWESNIGAISATAIWWLTLFEFKPGLEMVLGALLARFLLRRIPFVG